MNNTPKPPVSLKQYIAAWSVHALTASTSIVGLLTLYHITQHQYVIAFWLMAIAIVIDGIDGTLARLVRVKEVLPKIDGALLDNIVDYLNYVITPCFFLITNATMLPDSIQWWIVSAIAMCSAYQFTQQDAKTPDHFFKGFPCYWNIVVFYMYLFQTSQATNVFILALLCILIFVPIKYVYPSRLDYLTNSKPLKLVMHLCSIAYGISSALLLYQFPEQNLFYVSLSLGYVLLYLLLSLYRTYYPLDNRLNPDATG